jgi:hypothetical protein
MILAVTMMAGGILIAAIFTWMAASRFGRDLDLANRGVETTGTVVSVRRPARQGCHEEQVSFVDSKGQSHQFITDCIDDDLHLDDKVKVIYVRDRPSVATLRDHAGHDAVVFTLVAIGSVAAAIAGLVIALKTHRETTRRRAA